MRALEARKVPYEVVTFSPDIHSATGVAEAVGLPYQQVYKTLVALRPKGKPLLIMLAGDQELDLKRVAKAVGEKKVRMASHKEAENLTGLQVGGISALALLNRHRLNDRLNALEFLFSITHIYILRKLIHTRNHI